MTPWMQTPCPREPQTSEQANLPALPRETTLLLLRIRAGVFDVCQQRQSTEGHFVRPLQRTATAVTWPQEFSRFASLQRYSHRACLFLQYMSIRIT